MKKLALLLLMSSFVSAHAAMVKLDEVKDRGYNYQTASLMKNRSGNFELHIFSAAMFDGSSRAVAEEFRGERSYVSREIIIPVKLTVEINGIDKSRQFGGSSDNDIKTGVFSELEGKKVESLFEEFDGSSVNVGIALLGGGRSSGSNRDNVKFKDSNFAMIIGPSGSMGIDIGVSVYDYKLKMEATSKSAEVKYGVSYFKDKKNQVNQEVKSILSIEQAKAISLEKEI